MIKAGLGSATSEQSRNGSGIPGGMARYAPINLLRLRSRQGNGEINALQTEVARMMRTTSETAELPRRVNVVEDVTRGLGLTTDEESRIQGVVAGTNVEFNPKTQTQRIVLARGRLGDLLRSMKGVDSGARMEIAKRAQVWWKQSVDTDLNRSAKFGISYPRSMTKAEKPARWITVRGGARIPVGADGKLMGALGKKIMLHTKKRKKKRKLRKAVVAFPLADVAPDLV